MKLPRDLSGPELAKALQVFGYRVMRLTTNERGEHHVTIPAHAALRVGTLAGILGEVAAHFEMARDEVIKKLFGRA